VSRTISSVTQGSHDVGAAAGQVLESAGGLARQSETLRGEVSRFLAGVRG
jgi:methyl-accepting chemotaxis protein